MSQLLYPGRRVLWIERSLGLPAPDGADLPPGAPCCDAMADALVNACEEHADAPEACADMLIAYSGIVDEYGLIVHDGGASYVLIDHCPFCGAGLPASRRDAWFDAMDARGIPSPMFEPDALPPEFASHRWWSAQER